MKFIGLLSLICVFCLAVTFLTPEVDAKIKKIKIARKVAKLLLLRGIARPKVVLAVPLPVPIPILRKAVQNPISSNSWATPLSHSSTSYEIPSLASLPESILNLLRPALSTITASAFKSQAWPSVPLDAWSSPAIESWPAQAPVQQNAWPSNSNSNGQQQQEIVEQQQTNNYA